MKQRGFTLIELIIVIIILGILAVTAAPRFFNFASDARTSVVQAVEGSLKAASELVYARAILTGPGSAVTIDEAGSTVAITGRYADASAPGIMQAIRMDDFAAFQAIAHTNTQDTAKNLLAVDLIIVPQGVIDQGVFDGARTSNQADPAVATAAVADTVEAECYAVYRAAVAADPSATPPVTAAPPVIFSVTNGC